MENLRSYIERTGQTEFGDMDTTPETSLEWPRAVIAELNKLFGSGRRVALEEPMNVTVEVMGQTTSVTIWEAPASWIAAKDLTHDRIVTYVNIDGEAEPVLNWKALPPRLKTGLISGSMSEAEVIEEAKALDRLYCNGVPF